MKHICLPLFFVNLFFVACQSTRSSTQPVENPPGGSSITRELDPASLMSTPLPEVKKNRLDVIDPCSDSPELDRQECIDHWSQQNRYVPTNKQP